MHFSLPIASLAAMAGTAQAAVKGFNYGAFYLDQSAKQQADFVYEFNKAKNLPGTSGWNSARLYSMIQWGTASDVISAIPAAIETQTSLLLGLWTSGGEQAISNEITALEAAIKQYGQAFTDLVVGISVGSEDLYRDANGEVGVNSQTLIDYISRVRSALVGTPLEGASIGHVDTYDSFMNGTNKAVIETVDWIGFDGYPYWEVTQPNAAGEPAKARFNDGLSKTRALAGDKPVWVTETGWPVNGPQSNQAIASAENARLYWKDVACELVKNDINVWWYMLQESQMGEADVDFGLYGAGDLGQIQPYYDLSC